uniref:Amino acid transporter transmembrane domain-containing protein n=1 Tax=Arion vulgaris TaxID=1028688 RepID=A0A0B7B0L3_9EUPU
MILSALLYYRLYLSLNLMFATAVFLTVGVQFYVPVNIIWPAVDRKLSETTSLFRKCAQYITRASLLAVILLVAVVVPHLDLLMSFVGSFCGSFLTIILPALLEFITLYEERGLTAIIAAKDTFILAIGIIGFITGSYTSLKDIVNTF